MIKYSLTNCDSTLGENIKCLMHKYKFDMHQWYGSITSLLIGYEPAGLTVHPPQNDRGWVHFFRMGV